MSRETEYNIVVGVNKRVRVCTQVYHDRFATSMKVELEVKVKPMNEVKPHMRPQIS